MKKILAIGANGIIGQAVIELLDDTYTVIPVGYSKGERRVDIEDNDSIKAMYESVGPVDAIISMAGNGMMANFDDASDQAYQVALNNKVMGQVNVARLGINYLTPGGSITLTSGQASNAPTQRTAAIAMGVAAINAFVTTASLELKSNHRINAVSPSFVKETMERMGMDSTNGISAADVALCYQSALEGVANGKIFDAVTT
ncbi:short chain dehydrogenase [Vibrio mediterranei]|uniref:short chain dehydrogenase n=1 Tax=Vibrio mediterranei TaxID=689 RepID=UPI00148D8FCA|nr:short chain dehydrogenase [Vibrio mediterranei]NOI26445.1 short chain dehydrogenase [Vibrio mediterranei]